MNNDHIVHEIKDAKDNFGVLSDDSVHNQLNNFSANDWKQAAKIFSQDAPNSNGFYIDDNNGKVTIHNDLTQAQTFGERSTGQHVLDDAKQLGEMAAIGVSTSAAIVGGLAASATWSAGLSFAAGVAEGTAYGLGMVSIGGGLTAIGGPLAIAADVAYNMHEGSVARRDVQGSATVSV